MSYIDILLLCLTEIVGDFGFKEFANYGGIKNFAIGTVGYIGVIFFLIKSLQGSQILLVNSAWDGLSTLIESIAAMIILGERFGCFSLSKLDDRARHLDTTLPANLCFSNQSLSFMIIN